MGSGIQKYYEELEDQIWRDKLAKLSTVEPSSLLNKLQYIKDNLQRFVQSNPSLTKVQHSQIDSALKSVTELI